MRSRAGGPSLAMSMTARSRSTTRLPSGRCAPSRWAERIIFSVVRMEAARTRPPSIHCSERRSSTELIPNCGCAKC